MEVVSCYRSNKLNLTLNPTISAYILKKWGDLEEYFVHTRATEEAIKLIATEPCLVVTGSSGCGKSALVQHLALYLRGKGYNINIAKEPKDIQHTNNKQVFVLEDPFGTNSLSMNEVHSWEKELNNLQTILQVFDNDEEYKKNDLSKGYRTENSYTYVM